MRSRWHMVQTLLAIYRVWRKKPHQRLCQLIVNASGSPDPFYIDDKQLTKALEQYVIEHPPV